MRAAPEASTSLAARLYSLALRLKCWDFEVKKRQVEKIQNPDCSMRPLLTLRRLTAAPSRRDLDARG